MGLRRPQPLLSLLDHRRPSTQRPGVVGHRCLLRGVVGLFVGMRRERARPRKSSSPGRPSSLRTLSALGKELCSTGRLRCSPGSAHKSSSTFLSCRVLQLPILRRPLPSMASQLEGSQMLRRCGHLDIKPTGLKQCLRSAGHVASGSTLLSSSLSMPRGMRL